MSTISASKARAGLPEILDRVAAGDEVTITRHGRPVAVVVRPDALRTRSIGAVMEDAARVRHALATGRAARLSPATGGLSAERADELITDVRAGRDRA